MHRSRQGSHWSKSSKSPPSCSSPGRSSSSRSSDASSRLRTRSSVRRREVNTAWPCRRCMRSCELQPAMCGIGTLANNVLSTSRLCKEGHVGRKLLVANDLPSGSSEPATLRRGSQASLKLPVQFPEKHSRGLRWHRRRGLPAYISDGLRVLLHLGDESVLQGEDDLILEGQAGENLVAERSVRVLQRLRQLLLHLSRAHSA
eukprot:scaffold7351_cov259-Pinguiococcus_pyrenoidosus.AAC.18